MERYALASVLRKIEVGKIEQLAPRSRYKTSAECLSMSSIFFLKTILVEVVPNYVVLVENVVICCYEDVCGEIILQKFILNAGTDSD